MGVPHLQIRCNNAFHRSQATHLPPVVMWRAAASITTKAQSSPSTSSTRVWTASNTCFHILPVPSSQWPGRGHLPLACGPGHPQFHLVHTLQCNLRDLWPRRSLLLAVLPLPLWEVACSRQFWRYSPPWSVSTCLTLELTSVPNFALLPIFRRPFSRSKVQRSGSQRSGPADISNMVLLQEIDDLLKKTLDLLIKGEIRSSRKSDPHKDIQRNQEQDTTRNRHGSDPENHRPWTKLSKTCLDVFASWSNFQQKCSQFRTTYTWNDLRILPPLRREGHHALQEKWIHLEHWESYKSYEDEWFGDRESNRNKSTRILPVRTVHEKTPADRSVWQNDGQMKISSGKRLQQQSQRHSWEKLWFRVLRSSRSKILGNPEQYSDTRYSTVNRKYTHVFSWVKIRVSKSV